MAKQKTISLADFIATMRRNDTLTTVKNNTRGPLKARIFIAPSKPKADPDDRTDEPSTWCDLAWAPGRSIDVPTKWVSALVTIRDGQVMGGLAPQLTIEGVVAPLHPALQDEATRTYGVQS